MKKLVLLLIPLMLSSCVNNLTDFSGFWIEKEKENDRVIIKKNGDNYLVENRGKKYPAQIKDDLLEVSAELPMKATIDENDNLIIGGKEYIRIEKAKTYKFVKFEDCSLGDMLHISFKDLDKDFGANHKYNKYGDLKLCIDDADGNTIPNPEHVGKEFIIRWDLKKVKVADPIEPWKTSWVENPRITYLKLKE
jgi:hypothetical protein